MNNEILSGRWKEFVGEAKQVWGKLTDDDMKVASGNIDAIKGRLEALYGYSKERARQEVDSLAKKFSSKVADTSEDAKDFVHDKTASSNKSSLIVAFFAATALSVSVPSSAADTKSSVETKVENTTEKMRTTLYKWTDKDSLVLKFDKGSARISNDEKKRIRALMESNKQAGNDLRVTLAAWADNDYIKTDQSAQSASAGDKTLADKRLKAINDFLKSEKIVYTAQQEYNMAKEPHRFAKLIETRDAVLKQSVVQDKTTDSVSLNRDIELMKADGGAQKAIIALPER